MKTHNKIVLKTLLTLIILSSMNISIFAETDISSKASQAIDDFMKLRMNLAQYQTSAEAINAINAYHDEHLSDSKLFGFTEQEKMILKNFEVLELYNYMYRTPGLEEETKAMLKKQYDELTSWIDNQKKETLNKWLYTTAGDLLSCNLAYASVATIMHDGILVKTYYENAIEQDDQMSYALTNIAQWYYYAPAIGGGGKGKAKTTFLKAVEAARTDAERYYANIFLSQLLFEDKNTRDEVAKLLDKADSYQPNGRYVAWLRRVNAAGYSMYYYNINEKKIGKIE